MSQVGASPCGCKDEQAMGLIFDKQSLVGKTVILTENWKACFLAVYLHALSFIVCPILMDSITITDFPFAEGALCVGMAL